MAISTYSNQEELMRMELLRMKYEMEDNYRRQMYQNLTQQKEVSNPESQTPDKRLLLLEV